jgi:hypothetical protein
MQVLEVSASLMECWRAEPGWVVSDCAESPRAALDRRSNTEYLAYCAELSIGWSGPWRRYSLAVCRRFVFAQRMDSAFGSVTLRSLAVA